MEKQLFLSPYQYVEASLVAQLVKNPSWIGKISWIRDRLPTPVFLASLMAQMVKNLPAMGETWVRSLGWENPMEEDMATHSSILAGRMPWTEEPGGLQSMGSLKVRQD